MARNNKHTVTILTILVLIAASQSLMYPINDALAAKTRACTTNEGPKGVDSISSTEVWVANDGGTGEGTLQKFTNLSSGCTNTPYAVNGDPHFIDRSSSNKITFSEHVADKITYFDPSTNTQQECTGTAINDPDDVDSDTASSQYSSGYASGKLVKTVKGASSCTVTSWPLPGSGIPSGVDRSTDAAGFFVIDQANLKLLRFDTSSNLFTTCAIFVTTPWYVADDSTNDVSYVTLGNSKVIAKIGNFSCTVQYSSLTTPTSSPSNWPYDIAVRSGGNKVVVSFSDSSNIGIYTVNTDTWTLDNWSTECSQCLGFGIDAIYSSGDYYASLRGTTSKIVKGTF